MIHVDDWNKKKFTDNKYIFLVLTPKEDVFIKKHINELYKKRAYGRAYMKNNPKQKEPKILLKRGRKINEELLNVL